MNPWDAVLRAAAAPNLVFQAALADPRAAQTDLLLRLLNHNGPTRFGREHGFAEIRTVDDFRRATPVRDYASFQSAIAEISAGTRDVLLPGAPIAIEETGGTSSGCKQIPYTPEALHGFQAAILPWLANLAKRRPGVTAGSAYIAISPVGRAARETLGGIPIGIGSEAAYLGDELAAALVPLLAVPLEVGARQFEQWRLATLAHLVESENLSFVSVWSPTFFSDLIRALPRCADAIAGRLSPLARARLERTLRRQHLETSLLWPRLDTISCWADGSSAVHAYQLSALCPQAAIEPKGLLATEAAITVPWNGEIGCLPALASAFIEFVGQNENAFLADELEVGSRYRIVVTTWGGLYRYDMGDIVLCVGHDGLAPRLIFQGRAGLVSDMVGEKLTDAFVAGVLTRLSTVAALVPCRTPRPHYELWLDAHNGDLADAAAVVDRGLSANPQYSYARAIGQLGACVALSRPGFLASHNAARVAAGARLGDLKPTALILSGA